METLRSGSVLELIGGAYGVGVTSGAYDVSGSFQKTRGQQAYGACWLFFWKTAKNQRFLKKSDIFIMSSFYEKLLILVKGDDCKRRAVIVHGTA